MQSAKVKAEAQGRKAKVSLVPPEPLFLSRVEASESSLTRFLAGSLPSHTRSFSSTPPLSPTPPRSVLTIPARSEFSNKDLKSVGNYTLGRLIGKGSFGKVYLATHKLTNGSKASRAPLSCVRWRWQ